jgi:hypothetical protein
MQHRLIVVCSDVKEEVRQYNWRKKASLFLSLILTKYDVSMMNHG